METSDGQSSRPSPDPVGVKLLALLGLANRAGKLALGYSAIDKMVRRQQRPLILLVADIGASQQSKVERWKNEADLVQTGLTGEDLARALGRDKLSMVAVSETGFVKGIKKIIP